MRKTILAAVLMIAAALVPAPAAAWGFAGHQLIMRRALELLPPELKPLFDRHRDEIVIRVKDPDLWRSVGWDEEPNHFINFGAKELGDYPFTALPREYGAALEKFGPAFLERIGKLPWREAEEFGNLRRAFEGFARGRFALNDIVLFAPVTSHYMQDAYQPLHATDNYNGQLTGNTGVHSRFEADLIERFQSRLTLKPAPPKAITNPRDAAFDVLLASYRLVDPILKADSEASAGKDTYDDDYYEKFFVKVRPILEQRLSEAITATAGLIIGAWEQAGRPALQLDVPRPVQKVRRP